MADKSLTAEAQLGEIRSELRAMAERQNEMIQQVKDLHRELYVTRVGKPSLTANVDHLDSRLCSLEKLHEYQEERIERVREEQLILRKSHYWDIFLIIATAIITSGIGYLLTN